MKFEDYFAGNVRRDMLKISVISYKSSILPVHQLVLLNIFVFQISISNATLSRPTTLGTYQNFIRGVTAPGMNPLPIYIPFLTEKVSSFVYFTLKKMVSLKKSLFFASLQTALNALSLSFSFFKTVWIDKKKQDIFSAFCFLILPFGSFSHSFIYTFNIKIRYPPIYLKP